MILAADYNPCRTLRISAEVAGISSSNFPWKTTMWISKNHVAVRYGYRAPKEILYANKQYYRELIADTEDCLFNNREESLHPETILELEKELAEYRLGLEKAEE